MSDSDPQDTEESSEALGHVLSYDPEPVEVCPPTGRRTRFRDAFRLEWRSGERRMLFAGVLMIVVMLVITAVGSVALFQKVSYRHVSPLEIEVPSLVVRQNSSGADTMPFVSDGILRFAVRQCNTTDSVLRVIATTRWLKFAKGSRPVAVVPGNTTIGAVAPSPSSCDVKKPGTATVVSIEIPHEVIASPGTWRYAGDISVAKCLAVTVPETSESDSSVIPSNQASQFGGVGVSVGDASTQARCLRSGETIGTVGWFTENFNVRSGDGSSSPSGGG